MKVIIKIIIELIDGEMLGGAVWCGRPSFYGWLCSTNEG